MRYQVQYDAASTNYKGPVDCAIKVTLGLNPSISQSVLSLSFFCDPRMLIHLIT